VFLFLYRLTNRWVISKVLHTVCFLFKNEFILQNTFIGLQCNLQCEFITVAQRLGKSFIPVWTPSFLLCLITQVTSIDASSMLLKRFPRSGFFGRSQSVVGSAHQLVGSAHQTLTCSQNCSKIFSPKQITVLSFGILCDS
jgi:hypothetical protein